MKKIITIALVTVLCLATLASTLVSLSFNKSEDGALLVDGLALTVGDKTYQTTEPNYFVELSNDIEAAGAILGEYNMTHQYFANDGGYTKMTATTGDPYVHLTPPTCDSTQIKYIVIVYRTNRNGGGEIYVSKSNGEQMSQSTMVSWNGYNGNGEWNQIVVDISSLCKSGVTFTNFRYDPFHSQGSGAYIDVKGIAGFATKDDAEGFNFNQYVSYLDAYYSYEDEVQNKEFEIPAYAEKEFTVVPKFKYGYFYLNFLLQGLQQDQSVSELWLTGLHLGYSTVTIYNKTSIVPFAQFDRIKHCAFLFILLHFFFWMACKNSWID